MTDHDLRTLLHSRVQDATAPDLADVAWERARRIRQRRAGAAVAAVAAVAVLAGSTLWIRTDDRSSDPVAPSPTPTTSPTTKAPTLTGWDVSRGTRPDASYRSWPVYWGPEPGQEATLPKLASPLPAEIDLAAPARPLDDAPIRVALAAYTVIDTTGRQRLLLLAEDGSLRSVDVSRLRPLRDAGGQDVSVARETLLSPTGEFLAFPQDGRIELLTLETGDWRSIDTGPAPTAWVRWLGDTDLSLPPTRLGGQGPTYGVDGRRSGSNAMNVPSGPFDLEEGRVTGRYRQGPLGTAQTWAVVGVPVADDSVRSRHVLVVDGFEHDHDSLLALGESAQSPRADDCCSVAFWLDNERIVYESSTDPHRLVAWRIGTHELGTVATITGIDPSQHVVSSYVRVWQ